MKWICQSCELWAAGYAMKNWCTAINNNTQQINWILVLFCIHGCYNFFRDSTCIHVIHVPMYLHIHIFVDHTTTQISPMLLFNISGNSRNRNMVHILYFPRHSIVMIRGSHSLFPTAAQRVRGPAGKKNFNYFQGFVCSRCRKRCKFTRFFVRKWTFFGWNLSFQFS